MTQQRWRILFVLALTVLGLYTVAPTFIYFSQPVEIRQDSEKFAEKVPEWLPSSYVRLGLDLQGGVQLVLGVNTDEAIDNKISRIGTELKRWSDDNKKGVLKAFNIKGKKLLRVEVADGTDVGQFKVEFKDEFVGFTGIATDGNVLDFVYSDDQLKRIKESSLKQAERVIRSRIDKWGVTEPLVARRQDGSVLVQLPGFKDPSKAKDLLGRTAQLQFKIVDDKFTGLSDAKTNLPEGVTVDDSYTTPQFTSENKQAIVDHLKGKIPEGHELLFERIELSAGKKYQFRSFLVFSSVEISGEDVLEAYVTVDGNSLNQSPAVGLQFTGPGGKRFGDVTGANINNRMAIILDDEIVSAPNIQQKISGGNAQITLGQGNYQVLQEEAQELALILKSGALPARIEVLEERQVGATLGPELARQGILATGLGLVLVLVFMLVYYRRPGSVACAALVLNGLFLLALMTAFGFALTLPGIAGFILTLGMAVDANVLINERIRQEVYQGKNARKAVDNAFDKVFWTIVDANVTTLIAALVLLQTNSSGPIRGFAVTLMLGLVVSMFTSLFCTKLFFNVILQGCHSDGQVRNWLGAKNVNGLKVFNFNFLKHGKLVTVIGVLVVLGVIGSTATRGINWAVDFVGGTEIEVQFAKDVEPKQIRYVATEAGIKNVVMQALEGGKDRYLLRFEKSDDTSSTKEDMQRIEDFRSRVASEMAEYSPNILKVDFVGPQIGKELQTQGALSLFYAILCVFAYILLRFDMRFGPGAVLKMFQDVFIILGFYAFFWRSFDLTSVAALLTVVGYSVNDTIVIYDRIRENLVLFPKRKLADNINFSLNECLSRTINTSVTTIVALIGILIFGTSQIWNFAAAMVIGVIAATITSNFMASSFVLWFEMWRKNQATKKGAPAS
ncbi:protein translocase subunit SecD [Oligoflexaceae bacterium]|nr:protein translocase subunit SecD [Oligoflexaceae bacterium]